MANFVSKRFCFGFCGSHLVSFLRSGSSSFVCRIFSSVARLGCFSVFFDSNLASKSRYFFACFPRRWWIAFDAYQPLIVFSYFTPLELWTWQTEIFRIKWSDFSSLYSNPKLDFQLFAHVYVLQKVRRFKSHFQSRRMNPKELQRQIEAVGIHA